ncbi:MAG: hypothetical protein DRN90_03315 [Thermoproteota archaeon]|nr:MAG: hypothetical protein DRN90_03315 [Candidatus Korarchaeota archaeon]
MGAYKALRSHLDYLKRLPVDWTSSWSFTANDSNKLAEKSWETFTKVHLAVDPSQDEKNKGAWHFPVAKLKDGKVTLFYRGVVAAKVRAAQNGHPEVYKLASELLDYLQKKREKMGESFHVENDEARLLEAKEEKGWEWEVLVIEAGLSKNGVYYSPEVLKEAVPLYDGVKVFAFSQADHQKDFSKKGPRDLVGWLYNPEYRQVKAADGRIVEGIVAIFRIAESADWLRKTLLSLWEDYKTGKIKDPSKILGFSHDGIGKATEKVINGQRVKYAESISYIDSVDVVVRPAAGGGKYINMKEADEMWREKIIALLKGLGVTEIKEDVSDEELLKMLEAALNRKEAETKNKETNTEKKTEDTEVKEALKEIEKMKESYQKLLSEMKLEKMLGESDLPEKAKEKIRKQFRDQIVDETKIKEAIEFEKEYLKEITGGRIPLSAGGGNVEITKDEKEKWIKAMEGFFDGEPVDGVAPFVSLREAYSVITGKRGLPHEIAREILREAYFIPQGEKLQEAITTTTFANILANAMYKKLLKEYNMPFLQEWKKFVSDIVPLSDMKQQSRVRIGGYGELPTVNEGADYQYLTTPGEEKATYSPSKYGGLEALTYEAILNDDVKAIRNIPTKLGRAAAYTLYKAIFDIFVDNPTIYDGNTLFDSANHSNLGSSALSSDALSAVRKAMRQQAQLSSGIKLGLIPRFLIVPPDLEKTAFMLARSEYEVNSNQNATVPNIHKGVEPIIVDYWTDANDWVVVADPKMADTIEVGFLGGKQEPELFVADNPAAGKYFTADKVEYKIRHIWGYVILDYRPFYKNVVT